MNETLIYVFLGINTIWLIVLTIILILYRRKTNRILSGVKGESLEKILELHMERVNKAVEQNMRIEKEFLAFKEFSKSFLYRVGFKRFNPFQNTGGDQSFAVAILDDEGDGVVFSSMHAREGTRIYAKPVKGGIENAYKFSHEEKEVIDQALR